MGGRSTKSVISCSALSIAMKRSLSQTSEASTAFRRDITKRETIAGIRLGGSRWPPNSTGMAKYVHDYRNRRESLNGGLRSRRQNSSFEEGKEHDYPGEESEKRHRDVKPDHDEEIPS